MISMDPQEQPYYAYQDEETAGSKFKNSFIELIEFVAILVAIFAIIRFFVAQPHKVSGNSMVPNFHNGDMLITYKLAVTVGEPVRGQVVILQDPLNSKNDFIKRIVGLPNEKIKISDGKVYINGQVLPEPYLPPNTYTQGEAFLTENEEIIIPDGQYFVIGDNRGGSSDSRQWGPAKKELLIGQVIIRYYPLQKFTLLKINNPSI